MKRDVTLVILAGGMGSRFGGLKQIEPMGPNGEFIIDYSIFDAIKAGFNKVVFLIKKEKEWDDMICEELNITRSETLELLSKISMKSLKFNREKF